MILDEQSNFRALDDFFMTPQGMRVAEAFASELESVAEFLHGYRLIQLGSFGQNTWLSDLSFSTKWCVSPVSRRRNASFYASMNALPIERHSIDCVIAPFTTELFSKTKHPLDEIDRILKPMGYAIFFGINPWSLWSIARHIGYLKLPLRISSALTLKRNFLARGYSQCLLSNFYYIPPLKTEKCIHKLEFLNEMGKMVWAYPASFYCFIAQKYDPCLMLPEQERSDFYFART